ncbi:MAG: DUF58 domain-containing protein [Planctomycetota bacterium]
MKLPRPTALGVKASALYVLLLGAFFAAPYANLFFLLLAFLTVLGFFAHLWTYRNLAGVAVEVGEVEPTPAGTGAPLGARVDGGRRTRFAVRVEVEIAGHGPAAVTGALVRGETRLAGRLPPLPRGLYTVRRARLASTWPLGLFRAARAVEAPREVVVFPAPKELPKNHQGGGAFEELCGLTGVSDGFMQPSSLREYRPGDELRMIHWKASARRTHLVIKEWEGSAGSGHEVVLDRRADREPFEEALSVLSAVGRAAREQSEPLTLHTQGLSATFGSDHRPWRELLRFLAETQPLPPDGPPPPPASPAVPRLPVRTGGGP